MLIFGLGAIVCVKAGLFDGDNVPDFIAKRDDLEFYFKSLAAPPTPNETTTADGSGKGGDKKGKPEVDPFAAPADEDGGRF